MNVPARPPTNPVDGPRTDSDAGRSGPIQAEVDGTASTSVEDEDERGPRIVVSVHDVAPATAAETARWCADADSFGIPVSLLVIPGPWRGRRLLDEPEYADVLRDRQARGDELVLHGWTHRAGPEGSRLRRLAGRMVARGAAEFAALDEAQAAQRLAAAREVLGQLGLTTTGFTPPGWLASAAAERALASAGFRYTTTHRGVRDLGTRRLHRAFALSHRPTGGPGERIGAAVLRSGARRAAATGGLVRVALHPDDLHRPGLRDTSLRAIDAVLSAGGRALTYGAVVEAGAASR
jgi:uncharacterized protein